MVQVGKPPHSLIHIPLAIVERERVGESPGWSKPSLAVVEGNPGLALSESNNIRTSIPCQVHNKSRVLVYLPPLLHTEVVKYQLGWLECATAIVVRNIHPSGSESDDISTLITSKVGNIARVLVDLPSLIGSEVVDDAGDRTKFITSLVQGDIDSGSATAYDIHLPVARQVGDEARVLVNAPATGAVAEVVDDGLDGGKCTVVLVDAYEDMAFTESYDIGETIPCGVAEEAKVTIEAPTPSLVTEVLDRVVDGSEVRIAIVPGNEYSAIPKSDNVAPSDFSNIAQIAEVLLYAPATSIVGEIGENGFGGFRKGVVAVVDGRQDATVPKSNDIGSLIASYVANEADVFIATPPSCIETKVVDHCSGLGTDIITHDHDSILTKANDIRKAWAGSGN